MIGQPTPSLCVWSVALNDQVSFWLHLEEDYIHSCLMLGDGWDETQMDQMDQGFVRETGSRDHPKCDKQCPTHCTIYLDPGTIVHIKGDTINIRLSRMVGVLNLRCSTNGME